jgi:hypothetical protein
MKQQNFINKFREHLANTGLQRSNRFITLVHGPSPNWLIGKTQEPGFLTFSDKQRLALMCSNVTLPGKSIATQEFSPIGSGSPNLFPYAEVFANQLSATFMCSTDFYERKYFIGWNKKIIDSYTHDVALYSRYAKPFSMVIAMLPQDVSSFESMASLFENSADVNKNTINGEGIDDEHQGPERKIYFVRVNECYPVEISEAEVSQENKDFMKFTVKFNYNTWDDPLTEFTEYMSDAQSDDTQFDTRLTPFETFRRIARDVARYSNPAEFKQLVVDKGLAELNNVFGTDTVEQAAQAGQIVDVYSQGPKTFQTTTERLIGPLGLII